MTYIVLKAPLNSNQPAERQRDRLISLALSKLQLIAYTPCRIKRSMSATACVRML